MAWWAGALARAAQHLTGQQPCKTREGRVGETRTEAFSAADVERSHHTVTRGQALDIGTNLLHNAHKLGGGGGGDFSGAGSEGVQGVLSCVGGRVPERRGVWMVHCR